MEAVTRGSFVLRYKRLLLMIPGTLLGIMAVKFFTSGGGERMTAQVTNGHSVQIKGHDIEVVFPVQSGSEDGSTEEGRREEENRKRVEKQATKDGQSSLDLESSADAGLDKVDRIVDKDLFEAFAEHVLARPDLGDGVRLVVEVSRESAIDERVTKTEKARVSMLIEKVGSQVSPVEQRIINIIRGTILEDGILTADIERAGTKLALSRSTRSVGSEEAFVWDSDDLTIVVTGAGPLEDSEFATALRQLWPCEAPPSDGDVIDELLGNSATPRL